ncbi:hypothetical protein BDN72DRAFT_678191 [Pluteus cervinus]|uniref:Uncharacterized protein n=1 Tax=Pluteus cervinus TaxID=181527 RepID=A0ACD3AS60_9AGAR|nr:hypothetical protein BDN72DRAFT_678191 [Pluteus cervinus]
MRSVADLGVQSVGLLFGFPFFSHPTDGRKLEQIATLDGEYRPSSGRWPPRSTRTVFAFWRIYDYERPLRHIISL